MENNGDNKENIKSGGGRAGDNPDTSADPIFDEVVDKIQDAESVLVALSNDPSVDEIAAAMGLSMALDAIGKHVTAIYSGKTPNVLEFLKPRDRFEKGTESLQDFVIALNKDKADHLRYKIDGDFVKVYVTPYKTTISGDDLEFSRGDYNVDLVIALNVPAATDLDAALKEHGRIMHDATSINITNNTEGRFGDVEWVDQDASSISEMVAKLAFELNPKMDSSTATALLTGLVAATDRFKNEATTPGVMVLAAKLMGVGADQQLVVQNVQGEVVFDGEDEKNDGDGESKPEDATKLEINHDNDGADNEQGDNAEETGNEENNFDANIGVQDEGVLDDSGVVAENFAADSEANNESHDSKDDSEQEKILPVPRDNNPSDSESTSDDSANGLSESENTDDAVKAAMAEAMGPSEATDASTNAGTVAGVDVAVAPENADGYEGGQLADQILSNIKKEDSNVGSADYGKMIDEALSEPLPNNGQTEGKEQGAEEQSTSDAASTNDNGGSLSKNTIVDGGNSGDGTNADTETQAGVGASDGDGLLAVNGGSGNSIDNQPAMQDDTSGNSDNQPVASNDGDLGTDMQNMPGAPVNMDASTTMIPKPKTEISEEEALDMIKQGQEETEANLPGMPVDGEMPKIITGGGMSVSGEVTGADIMASGTDTNPAMVHAPEVEATESAGGVPDMNFGENKDSSVDNPGEPNAMPLPGQEMAPPPVAPMPDFGAMPPAENTASSSEPELPQMPSVTVQPDVSIQASEPAMDGAGGLPQMPQVGGMGGPMADMNSPQTSNPMMMGSTNDNDPSAFKIPGIHT